jgi:hypothetical protein
MGNSIDDFCKCQNNDIITQMKLDRSEKIEKDLTTRTNSNSYSKLKSKNNIQNKDLIKCNSINSTLNFENNQLINQIKQNSASRKITNFFRLVKIKKESLHKLLLSNEFFIDFNKNNTFKKENNKNKNINNKSERQIKIISDYIKEYSPSTYLGPKTKEGKKTGLGFQIFYTNNKDNNDSKDNLIKSAILICKYKNNFPYGIGKAFFIKKYHCYYFGEFKNFFAEGYGIYYHNEKSFYEGYWKNDSPYKIGIEKWDDNSFYEGEYFNGKKNGIGIYNWNNGSYYYGEWKNNLINGFGIYHYYYLTKDKNDITNNNNFFKNDFNNKNHNNNAFNLNDSCSNEIFISNNCKKFYIGSWKNNLRSGLGEIIYDNKKYFGYFKNDKKNGFGIMYWINSNKAFIGFWRDGKQIGIGKCFLGEKIKFGFWNENNKVFYFNEDYFNIYLNYWNLKDVYSPYEKYFKFNLSDIQIFFENDFSEVIN